MSKEIITEIIIVSETDKASRLLLNQEATKCSVPRSKVEDCINFDWHNTHNPLEGPHGETLKGTIIGNCKITSKPCLKMARIYASTMRF